MIYTLENILIHIHDNPVRKQRIILTSTNRKQYRLISGIKIRLSNEKIINIPQGFEWDLSSSPRIFWPILPPDGDFELAALIHDFIYRNGLFTRAFADKEMFIWSKKLNKKMIDNEVRYLGVRAFGWLMYKKNGL